MSLPSRGVTVGQLARRSGVAASALRFYEDKGLLHPQRNASGYRVYPRATLRRIAFIVAAQRVGLSLDEIRAALDALPRDRTPSRDDWAGLSATWTARIEAQIDYLERLRDNLTGCVGCGCLSLDRCPLTNADDKAGADGPGARTWLPPSAFQSEIAR